MLMKIFTASLCLTACASSALAQGSAILEDKSGVVLVGNGRGFLPALEGARLAPDDRVIVQPRGRAFLVYANGCRIKLKPGAAITVGRTSCAEGQKLAAEPATPVVDPVVGGAGIGVAPLVVGGVVLAGAGIGVAIALSNSGNGGNPNPPNNGGGGGGGGTPISP